MKFVVLLIGLISCDIFSNKDFEKLLEGKDGSKSELTSVEVDKDMLMESSKPGGQAGGEQGGKPGGQAGGKPGGQQEGKPGGQPGGQAGGQQGGKPGDKKAGGKPGDKADGKEGGNPKINTIKVQDKEAVMVNGDDNNAPKVVIISNQGANKSEEEILKIAEEVKGKSGGDKQGGDKKGGDTKQGGDKKGGAPKQGGDTKQGGAPKQGGDKAPGAPNQGPPKQGGTPPKQKLAEDSESLSLLSFETAAGTQEGEKAQESLNNLIQESKKSDGKNSKNKFWTTVLVDNNPRKVLVNVKTITVLESISDKKENKDKKNGKSDKEVSSTIGGVVPKDEKADDKKEKKEEEKKAKDRAGDKKDDDKKDDKKAKEVKKSVDESVKKAEEKSKEAKKSVEDSKKEQDKSKKDQDKKDQNKDKKEQDKKEQDKSKKEQDKDKKDQNKDEIKYETPDIKPGESSNDDKNSGIFTGIFGNNKESSNKQEGTKRLQNGSKDKIKSTVTSSKMSYVTKIEGTKTKVMPAEEKGKKGGDKEAGSSVSIDKKDKDDKDKDNKKDEKDKKDDKDKKDEDKNKDKDTKDNKDKNKDNKNPLESVIFMGDDVPKNKPQSPSPKPSKDKESSMDDLFFVLKNMPNKSKGKEGKELYVEGDFETPKDNKLEKKKFKFVGLIKSSGK